MRILKVCPAKWKVNENLVEIGNGDEYKKLHNNESHSYMVCTNTHTHIKIHWSIDENMSANYIINKF